MNTNRKLVEDFYLPAKTSETGTKEPQITWNGHTIDDPVEFRKTVEEDFTFVFYNTQSVDCQVLSSNYQTDPQAKGHKQGENIVILVMTSGYMRLQERGQGPMKEYSESFVLVPNPGGKGAKSTHKKRFLIQSQNFRWVVSHENAGPDKMMDME